MRSTATTGERGSKMYRLSSINGWFDKMTFDSLAAAKEKADQAGKMGSQCDVLRNRDRETFQAVYSADSGHMPMIRGTYSR